MTEVEQAAQAGMMMREVTELQKKIDDLMRPIVLEALRSRDLERIRTIAAQLPDDRSYRFTLERGGYDIQRGVKLAQGARPEITLGDLKEGAQVMYSDRALGENAYPRTVEQVGTIDSWSFTNAWGKPSKTPTDRITVYVIWPGREDDYPEAMSNWSLSRVPD